MLARPKSFFLCHGAAEGYTPLNAFDACLLAAGVGNVNLIKISSILPPGVRRVESVSLEPGSFIPVAYASIHSVTPMEVVSAAVAVAIPARDDLPGVIMEYSARGQAQDVEPIAVAMADSAMRTRNAAIKEIISLSAEHRVTTVGAAFAGCVLC